MLDMIEAHVAPKTADPNDTSEVLYFCHHIEPDPDDPTYIDRVIRRKLAAKGHTVLALKHHKFELL